MICMYVYVYLLYTHIDLEYVYGWATSSRLLKIIGLFYKALLQKRPIISRSLLIEATPYLFCCIHISRPFQV